MTDTEQATELLRKIEAAQRAFDRLDGFDKLITESEVRLRYDAIVGSLLVFESDVRSMRDQWKAEDIAEAAAAELAVAPENDAQQLKAEIVAIADVLQDGINAHDTVDARALVRKLRQLSAV